MERRRQSVTSAFFLIQIILAISTCDVVLARPSSSSSTSSAGRPLHVVRSVQGDRSSPLPVDHLANHGDDGRPIFGTLSQRSVDNFSPDPDNYWDFVLGSGTFKRGGGNQTSKKPTSGDGAVRRFLASGQTRWPLYDVLGRKTKGNASENDVDRRDSATEQKPGEDLLEAKKKTGEFFPSSADDSEDFFDFLLGEHGR